MPHHKSNFRLPNHRMLDLHGLRQGAVGLGILLGFYWLGLQVNARLHSPLPSNVIGLLLFFLALRSGLIKLEWVESAASFLLRHMILFFAPLIVGAIVFFPLITHLWLPVTLGLIGSTMVVLLVTGWLMSRVLARGEPVPGSQTVEVEETDEHA